LAPGGGNSKLVFLFLIFKDNGKLPTRELSDSSCQFHIIKYEMVRMYIECKLLSVGKYISQWLCLPDIFLFYNMRPHGHGTKKICPALTPELAWFYIAGLNINTIQHGALEQFHRRTFCPGHLLQLFKLFLETCKIVVRHFNMTCFLTGRNLVG